RRRCGCPYALHKEIRNSNVEIRNKFKIQRGNVQNADLFRSFVLWYSNLFRISNIGFRIWPADRAQLLHFNSAREGFWMTTIAPTAPIAPDHKTQEFYVDALRALDAAAIPYAVGGGYAMAYYTGIARNTKDL